MIHANSRNPVKNDYVFELRFLPWRFFGSALLLLFAISYSISVLRNTLCHAGKLSARAMLVLGACIVFYGTILRLIATLIKKIRTPGFYREICFADDEVVLTHHLLTQTDEQRLAYDALWQVVESERYFYLFTDRHRGYAFGKDALDGGALPALQQLLQMKLGPRYKADKRCREK